MSTNDYLIDNDDLSFTTNKEVVVEETDHEQSLIGPTGTGQPLPEPEMPMVSGQRDQAIHQFHKEIRGIR